VSGVGEEPDKRRAIAMGAPVRALLSRDVEGPGDETVERLASLEIGKGRDWAATQPKAGRAYQE